MKYRRFGPLDRDLSTLVLGTALYRTSGDTVTFEVLDEWVRLGGNALDTAREYGNAENVVGRWMAERGCKDDVVLLTKGAHHDGVGEVTRRRVTPEEVQADLSASLAALGVSKVDLYALHRDDPSRRVGPIVDALNEERRAGRVRALGASNWSIERLDEANRYAAERGLEGFSCSSVNLSLAVQNVPQAPEAVSAHDPASLSWYARTQMPLLAWSAQAGGFFTGRYSPEADIVRVYHSDANFERKRRAQELAVAKGTTANDVALAWVLQQPFPTYAIIGPRTVEEVRTSVAALDVALTDEEVGWLDLR